MNKEQWADIFVLAGLSRTLAYRWWSAFSATPEDNNKEYCDKLRNDYPDKYNFLMENSVEFREVCCLFANHSGHPQCVLAVA